jgi:hypothetical protein
MRAESQINPQGTITAQYGASVCTAKSSLQAPFEIEFRDS